MKKLIKSLLSRITIVLVAILIQIAIWVVIFSYLENNPYLSGMFNFLMGIVSILIIISIINKNEQEVFKLPWIVIVLIAPVFGSLLYLALGRNPLSKKQIERCKRVKDKIESKIFDNIDVDSDLKKENLEAYGQSMYIKKASKSPVFKNTSTSYLSSGEKFYQVMLESLKEAKDYIMLEYFIIASSKMLDGILDILYQKVKDNVEVFLMYDDIGTWGRLSTKQHKYIESKGIKIVKFNPFKPVFSVVHNNRDHRKIMVVDGKVGIMGGINIGDEYINIEHPFGYWKDSAVLLKGDAVNSLVSIFAENYNAYCKKEYEIKVENYFRYNNKEISEGFVQPFKDGPFPMDKDHVGETVYSNLINQAKKYIYITTPYLIVSYNFLLQLANASKRGVDVCIITPHIPDKKIINIMTKSNYQMLIESGVKIYEFKDGFIHAKNFIVDDVYAVCGTINLDYRSFVHHFECGVWMYKSEAVLEMKEDFIDLINNKTILIEDYKLSFFKKIIKSVLNLFSPLL